MDLLRIDACEGVCYIDARMVFILSPEITAPFEGTTSVQVIVPGSAGLDLHVQTDVDEFAQQLERSYHGCKIYIVA